LLQALDLAPPGLPEIAPFSFDFFSVTIQPNSFYLNTFDLGGGCLRVSLSINIQIKGLLTI
jgi:hypothetical protein